MADRAPRLFAHAAVRMLEAVGYSVRVSFGVRSLIAENGSGGRTVIPVHSGSPFVASLFFVDIAPVTKLLQEAARDG